MGLLESFASKVFASELAELDLRESVFKKMPVLAGSTTYLQVEHPQRAKEAMLKDCVVPLALSFAVGQMVQSHVRFCQICSKHNMLHTRQLIRISCWLAYWPAAGKSTFVTQLS